MPIGTKSGVLEHYCNVQTGEGIDFRNRENIRINVNDSDNEELYAGRVFHIDENGLGKLGIPEGGVNSPLYIAHRGVEAMDINPNAPNDIAKGLHAVQVIGQMGQAVIAGIPLREGFKVDTTEFDADSDDGYTINTRIYITADGIWTSSDYNAIIAVGRIGTSQPADPADDTTEVTRRMDANIITVRLSNIQYSLA